MRQSNKTFLITRDRASNRELAKQLKKKSARVISWPSFEFVEISATQKIKQELKKISDYDWLIFTSKHAVESFFKKYFKVYKNLGALKFVKVASVGPETSRSIRSHGLRVSLEPKKSSVKDLAREKAFSRTHNLKIFMPQAHDAKKDFIKIHQKRHQIFSKSFYRKKLIKQGAAAVKKLKSEKVDWVLFYSPSAVKAFLRNFSSKRAGRQFLQGVQVAVMGETTADELRVVLNANSFTKIHQLPI